MTVLSNLLIAAILAGTPLLLGTLGNIVSSKGGNLNLGVEGMMFMGAAAGLAGAYFYEKAVLTAGMAVSGPLAALIALLVSMAAGALGALIYGFLTISMRADQNVTGLILAIFGTGLGNFFGEYMGQLAGGYVAVGADVKAAFANSGIPVLRDIPVLGRLLFAHNWMVYFALILAIALSYFFKKTRVGLNLRAVGENPATADAAGISVTKYKYISCVVGGAICGAGGMYMAMVTCSGVWVHGCVSGYGWLAVALVIFSAWNPARAMLAALIFGGLSVMRMYVPLGIPMQIYAMLPYVATVLVLIITSIHQNREQCQPAACGVNYFREER